MKRQVLVPLLLSNVLALVAIASAQTPRLPVRDAAVRRTGTAVIRGRVLAADSGVPVRRATIRVSSPYSEPRSTLTDAYGRFEFRDLPADDYSITASKNGFIKATAGATRPDDAPKPIKLGEGQVASFDVLLTRAGAIAGRIVDEFGDPVWDAQVTVLRSRSVGGSRRFVPAGMAQSNDLGQFRAPGLAPGTYFVAARAATIRDAESEDHTGYAPTYYAGATNVTQAQPVQVSIGQETGGIEIVLALARVAHIAGFAFDSRGRPPVNSSVRAMVADSSLAAPVSVATGSILPNGSFVITGVPPGDYRLEMRVSPDPSRPGAREEYGFARVSVAGADVTGVTIQALPGATISGQVVFDRTAPSLKKPMLVATTVVPSAEVGMSVPPPQPAPAGPDGEFLLTGVLGASLFRLSGQPPGWTPKAIYLNGRDVIDTPILLEGREQITGVQIVLTDRLTRVTGSVHDEHRQPVDDAYVVILPDDLARFQPGSRFVRMAPLSSGAPLKVEGLPPGEYIGLALKSAPTELDIWEKEVFDYARSVGTRFTLIEGDVKNVMLTVVGAPARQ